MAHTFHIRALTVDDQTLDGHVHGGILLPPGRPNWHIHVSTTRTWKWETGRTYSLVIETREGRSITGQAKLRRSDGQAHYFVGDEVPTSLLAGAA